MDKQGHPLYQRDPASDLFKCKIFFPENHGPLNHSSSGFFRSRGAFFRIPEAQCSFPGFSGPQKRTERRLQKRAAEKDRRKGPQKNLQGAGKPCSFPEFSGPQKRTAEKDRRKGPSGGRRKPFQQTQSKKIIQNNLNNLK
jgi:hypothetical protein